MSNAFTLAHEFTSQWHQAFCGPIEEDPSLELYNTSTDLSKACSETHAQFLQLASTCDASNPYDDAHFTSIIMNHMVDTLDVASYAHKKLTKHLHSTLWQPLQCHKLPISLANVLYDSAVCIGAYEAVRLLQQCANIVGDAHLDVFFAIPIDGICGKKTIELCRELQIYNLDFYTARMFVRQRMQFMRKYASNTHSAQNGQNYESQWKKRCQKLLEHLALLERDAGL